MTRLSTRFPCIDFPDPNITLMAIPRGLKRINWLTFVGRELLDGFEGLDELAPAAGELGITTEQLPGGVMITAGDHPVTGDVNRQVNIDAYHAVGRALAPLRCVDHGAFLVNEDFDVDEDRTERWLAYFDGAP